MGRSGKKRRRPTTPAAETDAVARRLWRFLKQYLPLILGGGAGISAFVVGLGLFAHRSREELLGLGDSLSYPTQEAVLTSWTVIWSLLRNAILALFSGEPWLLAGAWGCLAALLLVPAADRWLPEARRRIAGGVVLTLIWVLLLVAARFYLAALFPPHSQTTPGPAFDVRPGGTRIASTEFEAVSWLTNDEQANDDRRQALAGLAGWFLLAAGWSGYRAYRRRELPRRWRQGLVVAYVLMVALVASMVPRAHAVAAWGLKYPRVMVFEKEKCDPELARALSEPGCCLFDVSAGGSPRKTLLWGEDCSRPLGFQTWSKERADCLVSQGERVIGDDC
ncbi:MAG: hypothetical protein GY856_39415 [bacterium]|nr:hypothetical protein [bacterium]